jgi:DNA-binding NtrC family response regulator
VDSRSDSIRQERYRLLFATADDAALVDIGQELAPAFFVSTAMESESLFRSMEEQEPDLLVIDLDTILVEDQDPFVFTESLRARSNRVFLLVISRTPLRNARRRAKQAGADEFLLAPIDFAEMREYLLEAVAGRAQRFEMERLQDELNRRGSFCGMVGASSQMRRVYDTLSRVAASNTTVMIRGESGTGKELAARAIVSLSERRDKPFISVNCAALPDTLMESELFGHEKGSFTGAHMAQPGQIELADGGTLFLDEIGSLGVTLQGKLLRTLQERTVQRIGAKAPRKIDFRLITATNDNLEEMVKKGQFREDLYYRISVVPIALPPLREREGDIPLLLAHYVNRYCKAHNVEPKRFSPEAMQFLETSTWPGNVREMENLVQRLTLMVDGETIGVQHLPEQLLYNSTVSHDAILVPGEGVDLDDELKRIEIAYIQAAMRRAGTKNGAASLLHIPVQKMKYLCRKYGIAAEG